MNKTSRTFPKDFNCEDFFASIALLFNMYKAGALGGEVMPEDSNPGLPKSSAENLLFFTLPMALNYQRNSYSLWKAATKTFHDPETRFLFSPRSVMDTDVESVRHSLLKHRLGLQPVKHVDTWVRICATLQSQFGGDVRQIFSEANNEVEGVRRIVQSREKKGFPYLSGPKIFNYWLYVLTKYADLPLEGIQTLSIAPDTHIIQATIRLGLVDSNIAGSSLQSAVAQVWCSILQDSQFSPIDLHTPLWLWSRSGFPELKSVRDTCASSSKT